MVDGLKGPQKQTRKGRAIVKVCGRKASCETGRDYGFLALPIAPLAKRGMREGQGGLEFWIIGHRCDKQTFFNTFICCEMLQRRAASVPRT